MSLVDYWNNSHIKYKDSVEPSNYAKSTEVFFTRNSHILELGGGVGRDSKYFESEGHSPVIIDISNSAKEFANTNIKYIVSDFLSLPYDLRDNSFDIVYSRLSLQYFTSEQMIRIYNEIVRILKPGGRAYIAVKSFDDQKEIEALTSEGVLVEENVYKVGEVLKSRFSHEQIRSQFKEVEGVKDLKIEDKQEILNEENKHGNGVLLLTEISFAKV